MTLLTSRNIKEAVPRLLALPALPIALLHIESLYWVAYLSIAVGVGHMAFSILEWGFIPHAKLTWVEGGIRRATGSGLSLPMIPAAVLSQAFLGVGRASIWYVTPLLILLGSGTFAALSTASIGSLCYVLGVGGSLGAGAETDVLRMEGVTNSTAFEDEG